jgi:hypothetical protein
VGLSLVSHNQNGGVKALVDEGWRDAEESFDLAQRDSVWSTERCSYLTSRDPVVPPPDSERAGSRPATSVSQTGGGDRSARDGDPSADDIRIGDKAVGGQVGQDGGEAKSTSTP